MSVDFAFVSILISVIVVTFFQLQLDVKWELQDQDKKEVYCWQLPVKIVDGEDDFVEM